MWSGGPDIPVIFISASSEARVSTHVRLHRLQIEMKRHNQHPQRLVSDQVREIAWGRTRSRRNAPTSTTN